MFIILRVTAKLKTLDCSHVFLYLLTIANGQAQRLLSISSQEIALNPVVALLNCWLSSLPCLFIIHSHIPSSLVFL